MKDGEEGGGGGTTLSVMGLGIYFHEFQIIAQVLF